MHGTGIFRPEWSAQSEYGEEAACKYKEYKETNAANATAHQ